MAWVPIFMVGMLVGAPLISVTSIMLAGLVGFFVSGWKGRLLGGLAMGMHYVLGMAAGALLYGWSPLAQFAAPIAFVTPVAVVLAGIVHAWLGQIVGAVVRRRSAPREGGQP